MQTTARELSVHTQTVIRIALNHTDRPTDLTGSRNLIGQLAPALPNAKAPRSELRGPFAGTEFGAMIPIHSKSTDARFRVHPAEGGA